MFAIIQDQDPDIILFPDYDTWSGIFHTLARTYHLGNTLSRTGRFHTIAPRSYYSYGRMEHRLGQRFRKGGSSLIHGRVSCTVKVISGVFSLHHDWQVCHQISPAADTRDAHLII
jgi:hypothetical protein